MVVYRNSEEILRHREELGEAHKEKTYFVREGIVFNFLKNLAPEIKILELGCGAGELAYELFNSGFKNLDLVDIDDYLSHQELKNLNRFKKVDLNFEKLPFEENSFDVVLAIAILEHLENPFHFNREVSRVIKKGGILLLAIPYGFNLPDKINFLFKNNIGGFNLNNNHITFQTADIFKKCNLGSFQMKNIIISSGFIKFFGFKIRFPNTNFFNKLFGRKILYILEKI